MSDVPEDGGHYVSVSGHRLAVVRVDGERVQVIDDACPHAGGSLASGYVEKIDRQPCIVCPWHHWPFDLDTGRCPDNADFKIRTYPTRVVAGRVEAKLSKPPASP